MSKVNLDEAAKKCVTSIIYEHGRYDGDFLIPICEDIFKDGWNACMEQMMKEAIEGEVCIPNVWVEHKEGKELVVRAEISKELGFKFGDKVRVVVCKKED